MLTNDSRSSDSSNRRAIVIGGSIAGLLAARVLADYFDRITIVERDRFPEKPIPRQGVPQSYQLHALLTRGQRILEQLFPGLKDELVDHKAPSIDWTADCPLFLLGNWTLRFPSGITTNGCTRTLLETILRRRLASYSAVEFLEATQVTGLLANLDKSVVTGVRVKDCNGTEAELPAHLVVDASGRNSKAPNWLQTLGYEMPQETVVNSFLGYASRLYEAIGNSASDYKAFYLMPKAPDCPRGGVLYQVERGRWMVSLVGVGRDYPPTDEAGFSNFAQSLSNPEIYQAIKQGKSVSPIYGYRQTENCWRHYERLSRFPDNFIISGDAVCAFNPVYGQGMTVAALGALTLDECLNQQNQRRANLDLTGLAQRFQHQLAKVNRVPWIMATGEDFRWSTTEGKYPGFVTRLMHWYLDRVMQAACNNTGVYKVFIEVAHLLKPPTAFFQPSIVWPVLKSAVSRSRNTSSPTRRTVSPA